MDTCFPDWSNQIGVDFPVPNYKKPFRSDGDLVELLWQNGELIMQSQTNRKPSHETNQELPKQDQSVLGAGRNPPSDLILNDETVTWADFPIDECFDKEFCSSLLPQIQSPDPIGALKFSGPFEKGKTIKTVGASNFDQAVPKTQQQVFAKPPEPPLRFESIRTSAGKNLQIPVEERNGRRVCKEAPEQNIMTVGSSHCASNKVITNDVNMSWASSGNICSRTFKENYARLVRPEHEVTERDTLDQAITSSSDGSFCKTNDQLSNDTNRLKRKMKDVEESEQRSEATELESASANKSSQKSGITRKSRVAEVHNLSERRRRDRINEKMRALQELIPHSTKSDKASMLDEAIEYMKSLQLQLQLLWMGSGMAPMMLPGMQHYMSRLGMVGPQTIPSMQNLVRLSRLPLVDQALTIAPTMNHQPQMIPQNQAQMFGPINYQNQMQNSIFPEQYAANCMGFQGFQNIQQPMNTFNLGSQSVQQNHVPAPPSNGNGSVA